MKFKFPITHLEDLSPNETLKLRDAARSYQPEDVPLFWQVRRWIPWLIIALLILAWLWFGG